MLPKSGEVKINDCLRRWRMRDPGQRMCIFDFLGRTWNAPPYRLMPETLRRCLQWSGVQKASIGPPERIKLVRIEDDVFSGQTVLGQSPSASFP